MTATPASLPDVAAAFHWTEEPWGPALRCRPLSDWAPHVFSSRRAHATASDDLGWLLPSIGADRVATAMQVHGAGVLIADERARSRGARHQHQADVLISGTPGLGVAVRAADCVPLLIAARRPRVVAAVHAGWRGTAAGAATTAVAALEREYGVPPSDLVAAIGPCIGVCCYEVGSELVDAFAAAGHARHLIERWFDSRPAPRGSRERTPLHLDLALANRDQLVLAGVPEEHVHVAGLCTAMHLDVLTSYRAEKDAAGRLFAAICPPAP
jgi:YfiH family protein